MLVLYSACKHRRRLGALRSQAERKQVYVRRRRRRKKLEGLKAAQIEALALLVQRSGQLKLKGCLLAGLTYVSTFNYSQQGERGSQATERGEE